MTTINNYGLSGFKKVILQYDPSKGLYETKKEEYSSYSLVKRIQKIIHYIFNPQSRLAFVVEGITQTAKTIKFDPANPDRIKNFLRYTLLFRKQVLEKHNQNLYFFQKPLQTADLDAALEALLEDPTVKDSSLYTSSLFKSILRGERVEINRENVLLLAKIAHELQLEPLREAYDEVFSQWTFEELTAPTEIISFFQSITAYQLTKTQNAFINYLKSSINETTLDDRLEIAQECKCDELKQACHRLFIEKVNAFLLSRLNSELPKDPQWNELRTHEQRLLETQWSAAHIEPSKEINLFKKAQSYGLSGCAKKIYMRILELTTSLYIFTPTDSMKETLKNLPRTFKVQRLDFLKAQLGYMLEECPWDETILPFEIFLSFKTFLGISQSTLFSEQDLCMLFEYLVAPYIFEWIHIVDIPSMYSLTESELSGTELLKICSLVDKYLSHTQDRKLKEHANRRVFDIDLILKRMMKEASKLKQEERAEFYASIQEPLYSLMKKLGKEKNSYYFQSFFNLGVACSPFYRGF